ncbi:diguanylate cyclase/phosphodiesterase (GGDEF & EAL domains) with PAS/PAC sensor(s) [Labilithrix luteola]|uniref:Sensory/regulatory protein RpfC n=1 Tax=Labilithrix luteola TaxID=1391654 RepID=A0A0K1PJW3_9BACT|nr:PAS domain-containing protein [Labilithrix luteola]AKU93828.1 diguanylate cyclase/phosphodiesterase (GGDEF & EAL domains) with PAS/PAC sensor(s) [Labilithrix luteola]
MGKQEECWQRIVEALPQVVWTTTTAGITDYFSPRMSAFTGLAADALLGWGWLEALHPDDRASSKESFARFIADGSEFRTEYRLRRFDGEYRWFSCHGTPLRDDTAEIVHWVGTSVDVTDHKLAEEDAKRRLETTQHRLRDREDRFRATFENAAVGMAVSGPGGRFVECNQKLCDILGYSHDEIIGRRFTEFGVPDEQTLELERHAAFLRGELTTFSRDKRYIRKDGTILWASVSVSALGRDEDGKPSDVLAILQDISARKALEEDLQRTKDLLELGVRGSKVAIFDFDMPDGNIVTARQTMVNVWETLGYDPASTPVEFVPGAILAIHPDDLGRVQAAIHEYLASGKGDFEAEYRCKHRDGSVVWRIARGMAFWAPDGTPTRFIGSFFDVTDRKRIEERLRESEQRWRNLADTLPQFVFTTGPDGLVDYFSSRTMEYTGQPMSELVGAKWASFIHPDDIGYTTKAWQEAVEQRRPHEIQHRIRRRDGEYRWFTTRAEVIRDTTGRVYKWYGTCTDVTNFKALESELRHANERLDLAIRSSNLSIWEYDIPDGNIAHARETLTNVWESLGYDPADAPPAVAMVIHPDDRARVEDEIRAYLAGEIATFETEHRIRHRDGFYRWTLGRGVAFRDPADDAKVIRFVGTGVDITDIKRIEEDLHRARESAEAANRAKDEFLANVSHEIRTPMNAILGMTELALDSARTEQQKQLLSTVKSAARNLLGIINDLLDFSKIAAGKLALDEVDFWVRAEIGDTLRALAARAHRKGLELICHVHPDVPDALYGDAGRVRQVLMNLVGNAIKFTAQGEVVVEVAIDPERSSTDPRKDVVSLSFEIRDTGIGIAQDKQVAIFRAFEQADASTTRRYGGTGLGLTISAQIAALMGGVITVESELGRGSTFTFTARFARSQQTEQPSMASPRILEGLEVLIIDDNETNRGILLEWFKNWRMQPTAVGDAKAAFRELSQGEKRGRPYSLVLLDGRLPDVDGITLAEQIAAQYGSSKRLILLSSDDNPLLAARAKEVGIRAYLLKPTQQSALLETIWVVMSTTTRKAAGGLVSEGESKDAAAGSQVVSTPLRILVAEDNELNAALLETLLRKRGHRAQFAEDGSVALKRAQESKFDLVLLDLHMPEMDGFEVVRAIRERERSTGKHLPIIALTARSSNRDRDRCLAAGMDDFLPKPIEAEALWAALARITTQFSPTTARESRLLDPRAILRACAGDPDVFDRLREVFRKALPNHLARVRAPLLEHDLPRLAEAAHKLYGTLGAFSTIAGALALTVEDAAKREDSERCSDLVDQLDAMCAELLEDTRGLTMDDLRL